MLIKPKTEQEITTERQQVTEPIKVKKTNKKCLCSKCHKEQTYNEIIVPIQYGFNCKRSILIEGIERVCSVCGWHVDDIATTQINREIAMMKMEF